jgi:hypothetical protein
MAITISGDSPNLTSATLTTPTLTSPVFSGTPTGTGVLTSGTLQTAPFTAPNTYADFTGVPSWVKRITVMINGISTNGTSFFQVQLGDSGGIEDTGYLGGIFTGATFSSYSSGFIFNNNIVAANAYYGAITLIKINGNDWIATTVCNSNATYGNGAGSGAKTLSDTLTQVRITTVNGTDTFDAGSINILYE